MAKAKKNSKTRTVGEYLLDSLYQRGVEHIFGVPGDYVLRFDKCIEQHAIKFINATRESTSGYMADAYARLRGLGVACITYGVGITITNALAQAFVESSPLVVISGSAGTDESFREIRLHHLINKVVADQCDATQRMLFKHVTISQAILNDLHTARTQIDQILEQCYTAKKPVYIEIPRNIVDMPIEENVPLKNVVKKQNDNEEKAIVAALKEIEEALKTCEKPVIWVGHEIQRYGLASAVVKFAERFEIPIISSLLGKTAISEYHSLAKGVYVGEMSRPELSQYVKDCDCVFMLGLMLTDVDTGIFTAKLNFPHQVIINAETISVGHHHYKNICFIELIKRLSEKKIKLKFKHATDKSLLRKWSSFHAKKVKITTKRLFECIQKHLQKNHIVIADVGDSLFGSIDLILDENSFLASAHFGSLGFATPGAVGAQIAKPGHRVIAIVGDGAFQMTCMELSTAVRYHVDPIVILLNNHGYGTERPLLEGEYNDIQDWNYSSLPIVLKGGVGIKVATETEFENAFKLALNKRGEFHLIEVELGKTDFSPALQRFGELAK